MSIIKCPECKLVNWISEPVCKRCGLALQSFEAPVDQFAASGAAATTNPIDPFEVPADAFEPQTQLPAGDPPAFRQDNPEWNTVSNSAPAYRNYQPDFPKPKILLAVFSLISGIIGMPPFSTFGGVLVGGVLAIGFGAGGFLIGLFLVLAFIPAGLITGIVALRRANRRSQEYGGRGFAIGGIVCSSIALVILPVIAAIAVPNLLASRRAANEGAAVSTMRKLGSAEDMLMPNAGGHCGGLDVLTGMGLIDKSLEKGEKSGYRFAIVNYPKGGCEIHGTPLTSSTGTRSFYYSTNDGVVRAAAKKGKQADQQDPAIQDPYSRNDELPAKIALQKSR